MTRSEVEILLRTVYKGEGATKALSDLDKISASGSKLEGTIGKLNKTMGGDILGGSGGSDAFRRRNPHLFTPPMPANVTPSKNLPQQGKGDMASFLKNALFAATPVVAPQSILGNLFATRQLFGALNTKTGQGLLGKVGLSGVGAAAGITGVVIPALIAVGLAMKGLERIINGTSEAFERARLLYAKALTSGLGLAGTANKEALANIIGVSTKDVYQFGQAIAFIGPRLKSATEILGRTAPNLTSVSYEFKILELNISALFASLANDAAPQIRQFASGLGEIVKAITQFNDRHHVGSNIVAFLKGLFPGIENVIAIGKDSGAAPNPVAFMHQLRASALEHQGLIVGGIGGQTDYVAQTAKNTGETNKLLKGLMNKMKGGNGITGAFFDPYQSNP